MTDSDFGITRARWRDWSADYDRERDAVGASPPKRDSGGASSTMNDDAEDDTYTAWLPDPGRDTCINFLHPAHDYERCVFDPNPGGISAPMMPSTLFLREGGDVEEISPTDVQQRGLGDCHLLAPLAAMASTEAGRAAIRDAIKERKNDKGEVVGYSVRLYDEGHPKTFEVPAGAPYVVGHAAAKSGDRSYEIWPLVMEKAYAQARGGYNVIGQRAAVLPAMEALTGKEVKHLDAESFCEDVLHDPRAVLVFSSRHGIEPNKYLLKEDHAYAVTSRVIDGQRVLQLYNPWGHDQPKPIPIRELGEYFSSLDVGSVGGAP
jgi:hypothetical protein